VATPLGITLGLITLAVGVLGAAVYLLYKRWDRLSESMKGAIMSTKLGGLITFPVVIMKEWGKLRDYFKGLWLGIKMDFLNFAAFLMGKIVRFLDLPGIELIPGVGDMQRKLYHGTKAMWESAAIARGAFFNHQQLVSQKAQWASVPESTKTGLAQFQAAFPVPMPFAPMLPQEPQQSETRIMLEIFSEDGIGAKIKDVAKKGLAEVSVATQAQLGARAD